MWDFTQIYLFFLTEPLAALLGLFPLFQKDEYSLLKVHSVLAQT